MNIFLFIFLILYFILTRIRLDWAIMFLLVFLPAYLIKFSILGIPFTILEAMILICFFSWFIFDTNFKNFIRGEYWVKDYLKNRTKRVSYPFRLEIVLVLIISFIAVVVAGFSNEALGIWKAYFFEAILLFILVLNVFKNDVKKIIYSLSASAFIVSVFAVIQKFTGMFIENDLWRAEETRRVVSFFGYPNAVGLFLAPVVMVLAGRLWSLLSDETTKRSHYKIIESIFLVSTIIISILAIYFARSEGALVALFVAFIIFGLLINKLTRIIIASFLVITIVMIVLSPSLRNYVISKATLMDFSGQIRRAQWVETWEMLKDGRIIQGSGLASYQKEIKPYHVEGIFYDDGTDPDFHRHTVFNEEYRKKAWRPTEIYLYPHNIFLNFWTEIGLFGMIVFVWILIKSIYHLSFIIYHSKVNKNNQNFFIALGVLGAIITIIIHGLVDVPYFKNDLAVLFWLFIAMVSLIKINNKDK